MSIPLLKSKLVPPITRDTYMRRASVMRTFKQIMNRRCTLILGGAGYGKSSAIAQFIADGKMLTSWYTVSSEDDDLTPFLRYLVGSIHQAVPNFGEKLMSEWSIQPAFPTEKELIAWHAWFINELEQIQEPFMLVIDDYHLIDHVFSINFMMERILEHCPSHIHIVIVSRAKPKWPQLMKQKMNGQLLEVSETDLVFTEEEILVYFEDYFDRKLTTDESKKILEITEGWAIAVQLMAVQSTNEASRSFNLSLKPALDDLFHYLSEEVFLRFQEQEQQWLFRFAIYPIFSLEFIHSFYGEEAALFLEGFHNRHGFLQQMGHDALYRFHALFQQFLNNKWKNSDMAEYSQAHKEAAEHFEQINEPIQSLNHAIQSGDSGFLAQIAIKTVPKMLKLGQFDLIMESLKEIPISYFNEIPALYYFQGEANRYRAYYHKSKDAYTKCLAMATQKKDPYYMCHAHAGLAHIYLDTIQPGLANPHLENAISFANQTPVISPADMLNLKRQFAENLVNLGKIKEAKFFIEKEQLPKSLLSDGNLDARLLLRMGKLSESIHLLETRLQDSDMVPDSHRETAVLLSLLHAKAGNLQDASRYATKGIEIGVKEKSEFVEAVGLIRKGHAESIGRHQFFDSPEQLYMLAIEKMDQLDISRGKAEPYLGLALVKAKQGQHYDALNLAGKGLRETEKVQDAWLSAYIKIGITMIYFTAGEYQSSLNYAILAKQDFDACGDTFGLMVSAFWMAACAYETGELDLFRNEFEQYAEILVEENYFFFAEKTTLYGPPDIQQIHPMTQQIMKMLPDHIAIRRLGQLVQIDEQINYPGYTLHVQLLGPLLISLGTITVDSKRWQREKAKDLFVYLMINKDRFVPKEELVREIFKGQEEKAADRDFKVALNALYNVLEPKRPPRTESYFIQRKQTMYRINPKSSIFSDVEQFSQLAARGLEEKNPKKSMELLMSAEAMYGGSFYMEQEFCDWFQYEQDHFHQLYLQVLEKLAQNATRLQKFDQTIFWAEKLIRADHTWEESYRLLMFANYQKQNRSQALKWYNRCVKMLQQEFDLEPMETTEQMYELITMGIS